jgi:hypothetical protein
MNAESNRSLAALSVGLGAIFLPPLLMFGYVAYDQSIVPGHAGWAAWRALPFCVAAGTIIAFFAPFQRLWLRVLISLVYAPVSVAALMAWGIFVACFHGDCI